MPNRAGTGPAELAADKDAGAAARAAEEVRELAVARALVEDEARTAIRDKDKS